MTITTRGSRGTRLLLLFTRVFTWKHGGGKKRNWKKVGRRWR